MADRLVDSFDEPLRDADVTLDGTHLVRSSPSFAAQLVERILTDGRASVLRVDGAPAAFVDQLTTSAAAAHVQDRLVVTAHSHVGV